MNVKSVKKPIRQMAAGRFKAECLAVLDRVADAHEVYVVTKRGRPVAQISPIIETAPPLAGSVTVLGDILAPVLGAWDADR
ncbi:MAG: type II toxin-antitoxin system prevent-host-death family antitoxin [Acidobacteriota bacterium]